MLETRYGALNTLDFLSKGVDFLSKDVDFLSKGVDFLSKGVDFLSMDVDFLSKDVDFLSKDVDFLSKGVAFLINDREALENVESLMEVPGLDSVPRISQYKCRLALDFSIENEERMEKCT